MQWKRIDRCPREGEWICYKPREIDYLTGEEFWASEFKVAQVLWVDNDLLKFPVVVIKEGLEGDGAFDTIQLSDLTDLHCCSPGNNLEISTSKPRSPAERRLLKLKAAIRRQIEWYLSPLNLKCDPYLLGIIAENSCCSAPIRIFLTFPRIADITDDLEIVTDALRSSKRLKVEGGNVHVPPQDVLQAKKSQLLEMIV